MKLKNGGKISGGHLIVYTNAPESYGVPVAIFKASNKMLSEVRDEYWGPYVEIRWSNWKMGHIPKIQDTLELEGENNA